MVNYTWHNSNVPNDLKIKQVYGITFTDDGRTILRIEDDAIKLAKEKYNFKDFSIIEETI